MVAQYGSHILILNLNVYFYCPKSVTNMLYGDLEHITHLSRKTSPIKKKHQKERNQKKATHQ